MTLVTEHGPRDPDLVRPAAEYWGTPYAALVRQRSLNHATMANRAAILAIISFLTMNTACRNRDDARITEHVRRTAAAAEGPTAVPKAATVTTEQESVSESASEAESEADRLETQQAATESQINSIGMQLKRLPPGTFIMGEDGKTHAVTFTKPCYLGAHEVTQEQYERVMGTNPSNFKSLQNPVERVSWDDAAEFCRRLSALPAERAAGRVYRLPTEAEWEYACQAGSTSAYSHGDNEAQLGDYAWYDQNSESTTHPVGQKRPNAWGLYDMHGNVWEWCQDWYGDYPQGVVTDPVGPAEGSLRVYRGGSWGRVATGCRSAYRLKSVPSYRDNHHGFRVALSWSGVAG